MNPHEEITNNSIFDVINSSRLKVITLEKNEIKKQKERQKIRARKNRRATYDILPELRHYLKGLSEKEKIPASQFVSLALIRFIADYEGQEIDISSMKKPSKSPRYEWNIVFPTALRRKLEKMDQNSS